MNKSHVQLICSLLLAAHLAQQPAHANSIVKHTPDFCHELECPAFTVEDSTDAFETRTYEPCKLVSVPRGAP
jgi:hypothetical protein